MTSGSADHLAEEHFARQRHDARAALEDYLGRRQPVTVDDIERMGSGVFTTDDEVDAFIAFTYAERRAEL